MHRLTLIVNGRPDRVFELSSGEILLGRESGVHVQTPDPSVSRRHARLSWEGGRFWLEDLGSSNGTFINGTRITGRQPLQNKDLVGLGHTIVLRYTADIYESPPSLARTSSDVLQELADLGLPPRGERPQKATIAPPPSHEQLDQKPAAVLDTPLSPPRGEKALETRADEVHPAARLLIAIGGRLPQPFSLDRPLLTIGRLPENDIVIGSRQVSRRHARLEHIERGWMLTQLPQAGNAILYQGQPVGAAHLLRHGDRLQILGPDPTHNVEIEFIEPAASVHSGPAAASARTPVEPGNYGAGPRLTIPLAPSPADLPLFNAPANSPVSDSSPSPVPAEKDREQTSQPPVTRSIDFNQQPRHTFGRDPANTFVLDAPTVSRFHAEIEKVGERFRVRDLNSANGTFLNDRPVIGEAWLDPQSGTAPQVRIGPYRFVIGIFGQTVALEQYNETNGLRVDAIGLNQWVRKDLNLLQDISLSIRPREFVVVVGQSGGGKTTLVDSLAGYRPANDGKVFVNGVDIYENFEAVRSEIGYVPQRDIIHMELTVYQALDYSARLRMPRDTSAEERHRRVMEVLADLDLTHRKDVQISRLSGGQQKRVSIGVELLTRPGLFFLDEPTSGLDPGGETSLMQLMRKLADAGRTVVLITHATKNVRLADKVVFLARGGHLAWLGPPTEALAYFDAYRTESERRAGLMEFDEIYALLDDPTRGDPAEWGKRFLAHPAYRQYIVDPLSQTGYLEKVLTQSEIFRMGAHATPVGRPAARLPKRRTSSSISQFLILSSRNLRILVRDRFSLLLMLAVAPITGLLSFILSGALGRNPYDYVTGYFPGLAISVFTLPVFGVLVGCLAQMREFVKEADIYKRERLVNLRILPYVLSKIWVALLLAIYQAAAYVIIHYLAFDVPGGLIEMGLIYFSTVLGVLSGMMLGLLASALAPNANSAPLVMILFMIPNIVLAGVMVRLPGAVTAITSTRWAHEAIMSITGAGSDVIRDPCWAMDKNTRQLMTIADKSAAGCNCSGLQALQQESCNFPGVGQFYDAALDQPEPLAPDRPGDPPAEPVFPPPPTQPANPADPTAMASYLQLLNDTNAQVENIRKDYAAKLAEYQVQVDRYQTELIAYQGQRLEWEGRRSAAVSKAESLIEPMHRDHGWSFADKDNPIAYWGKLGRAWLAQGLIMLVAFIAIILLIKRKDSVA